MRVEVNVLEPGTEPRISLQHQAALMMALRTGSIEVGTRCSELRSREALAPVFAELNNYHATTHFLGQSTIFTLTADQATGEVYCLAHHVTLEGGKRRLMLASLRYLDTFAKMDGAWLFSERRLYVDWLEERALS
jgi:hypothetical protein